jgi:hypothetical protein
VALSVMPEADAAPTGLEAGEGLMSWSLWIGIAIGLVIVALWIAFP